jgi:hydroxyacylglutathione hydrolase
MREWQAGGLTMILETRAVGPFFKNGFVLGCEVTREGVVIDPGDEVEQLLDAVRDYRLSIRYILLTHAHLDHVTGVARAKHALDAPVGLHQADDFLYRAVVQQGMAFGLHVDPQPAVDFFYDRTPPAEDGTAGLERAQPTALGPWRFGEYQVWVFHTPGHCPGGVCLAVGREGEPGRTLFVGDTLFAGSIGRTDLPGGDMRTLLGSIRDVLFTFPDDTPVYSGHGDPTTIGRERRSNPFLT